MNGWIAPIVKIQPQLQFRRVRHVPGIPWWVEYDFNKYALDFGELAELGLYIRLQDVGHSTTRRGHRHLHVNLLAILERRDIAAID